MDMGVTGQSDHSLSVMTLHPYYNGDVTMFQATCRNNRDFDSLIVKQFNVLMDVIESERDRMGSIPRFDTDDGDIVSSDVPPEFAEAQEESQKTVREALVDFLAETIGWTSKFSRLTEVSGRGGGESDGEDYIREIFKND